MLIAILIGNNLVNIGASAIATVIATRILGSIGPGISVGVLTVVILIFGEVTPKSLATRYSERISLVVSPIVLSFQRTIYPLISLFEVIADIVGKAAISSEEDPTVTESELISIIGYGEEEGTIEQGERVLIERAFALSDLTVADVMTPRHKVFTYDGRRPVSQALEDLKETPYSRIPLFAEDPDEIQKILYLRDLMVAVISKQTQIPVGEIGRDAKFVPNTQPVTDTISGFRKEQQHMAIVVDEHGTMEGVVTFEDLLEELVGEIYDESDQKPVEFVELGLNKISVDGTAEVRLIEEYFDTELPGKSTDTINRWILDHTERIPITGETFALDNFEVLVKSATRRKIHEVTIERLAQAPNLLDM